MKQRRLRYQYGTIELSERKKGPDVWVYRYTRFDPHQHRGIRKSVVIGSLAEYPSMSQAEKAAEYFRMKANPDQPASRGMTFGALVDLYLADEIPQRHSTQRSYTSYIENYIRPKWSSYSLDGIKPFAVEQWLKELTNLAPKSRAHIRNIMRVLFNCAMRLDLLPAEGQNPMRLVRVPGSSKRKRTPRVLSVDEFWRLLNALPGEPFHTMVLLAACTGLRVSELTALKWMDFDFGEGTLRVQRAIVQSRVDNVKTAYSEKELPLDADLAKIMLRWKQDSPWNAPEDWVFASPQQAGRLPYTGWNLQTRYIRPAALGAGLGTGIGWHSLRHTYSTLLRHLGVDIKVQQELMRHADIRTTMNVYTQGVSSDLRAANGLVVRQIMPTQVM